MQFYPGEVKTAKVTMRNPTGKAFDYNALVYLGTDLAVVSEKAFSLAAGEEKQASFPVTMPLSVGMYPVYIGVFSGGEFIEPLYQGEDVVIAAPVPFTFSSVSVSSRPCPIATAWMIPSFSCHISNPGAETVTHTMTYKLAGYSHYYNEWREFRDIEIFELTLLPGASYVYSHDGYHPVSDTCDPLLAKNYTFKFWLEDEYGNKSEEVSIRT